MTLSNERSKCLNCGSSDGFATDEKGNGYCFSCEDSKKSGTFEKGAVAKPRDKGPPPILGEGVFMPIMDRKLTLETCKKYGIKVDQQGNHIYPYYNNGEQTVNKYRTPEKSFPTRPLGMIQKCGLFGKQNFVAGGPSITITEGELDAASAYQMNGSKYAAVSVQSSSSALRDCKEDWKYLNSFRKIIIAFDNDLPGIKAANKVVKLFPGKAFIMQMTKHNDCSDYLVAKDSTEWMKEWWNSKEIQVGGYMVGDALLEEMKKPVVEGLSLPWETLSKAMYGVRWHELITLGAGSGLGKTELFKEIIYHMISVHEQKCGVIFLEEAPAKTGLCIHGKSVNKRLQKPEYIDTRMKDILDNHEYGTISENLVVVDHKGESDLEHILAQIEYLVVKFGCKFIFLDHITAICEGKEDGNVNSMLHHAMEELNKLLQRHEFTLFMISHLNQPSGTPHEEGARVTLRNFYGSGAIKQRSNFVFGLEGDQQAVGDLKHRRDLRCLKDRELGEATGLIVPLQYDQDTGRLPEFDIDEIDIIGET